MLKLTLKGGDRSCVQISSHVRSVVHSVRSVAHTSYLSSFLPQHTILYFTPQIAKICETFSVFGIWDFVFGIWDGMFKVKKLSMMMAQKSEEL